MMIRTTPCLTNLKRNLACMLTAILFLMSATASAQAPVLIQTNLTIMLNAVQDGIYGSFIAAGSPEFKETYTQESFLIVSEQNAPRLRTGYDASYLTSMNIDGFTIYLWKLSYADGGDDSLLSLSVQSGFVEGFLIQ